MTENKSIFRVGDKVVAKEGVPYGITKNGWRGVVIGVGELDNITVQAIDGFQESEHGGFPVKGRYFYIDRPNLKRIMEELK